MPCAKHEYLPPPAHHGFHHHLLLIQSYPNEYSRPYTLGAIFKRIRGFVMLFIMAYRVTCLGAQLSRSADPRWAVPCLIMRPSEAQFLEAEQIPRTCLKGDLDPHENAMYFLVFQGTRRAGCFNTRSFTVLWVTLKIMDHFWLKGILRHLIFRGSKMGP